MHAVANAAAAGHFALEGGPLRGFLEKAASLSIPERGLALQHASEMQELSDAVAASGETEGAGTDDAQGQHFIAFVHLAGRLYELDGRTFDEQGVAFPVCHGPTSTETFLKDAAKVIQGGVLTPNSNPDPNPNPSPSPSPDPNSDPNPNPDPDPSPNPDPN